MQPSIAILGFGLTGRIAALMLSEHYQIDVYEVDDKHAGNSAGALAAAMLAPMAESVLCDVELAEQGLAAMSMWPQLLAKLDEPVFMQRSGSLVVAHHHDKGDLESFTQRIKPLNGYQPQCVDGSIINTLEPDLAGRFHQGVYLPCEGQLDNHAFYHASFSTLKQSGVVFKFNQRAQIDGQSVNGTAYQWIIDCRGLGAKTSTNPLRGVRGEIARVYAPEVNLNRPIRLMHPRYPIYIAPKPDHEFVIGATEIESQDKGPVTVRSTLELLSAAYTVHTGFSEGRVMAINAGLRPAFFNNKPKITLQDNVISINGLYRHGYLLGPKVVHDALHKRLL